jgi:hypothetical protein
LLYIRCHGQSKNGNVLIILPSVQNWGEATTSLLSSAALFEPTSLIGFNTVLGGPHANEFFLDFLSEHALL